PYLPPIDLYNKYLQTIWENNWITNNGPLVTELEKSLEKYLGVSNVHFISNCTTGLQIAIKAAEVTGEVITSAFSHVATIDAMLWTNCTPIFVDIDPQSLCIDPSKIETAITDKTSAILVTHVYGNACDVRKIEEIAKANHLKVIYDAAHAFGVKINKQSIFNYGDISVASFHATKLYHSVEGGAIITNDAQLAQKCRLMSNFGINQNVPGILGINAKNTEFHAAMGLCNLPKVADFISKQKLLSEEYRKQLSSLNLLYPTVATNVDYNYAYFPAIFPSETILLLVKETLEKNEIYPRRYFYPSFNDLPFCKGNYCQVSQDISKRILCLPLYYELSIEEVKLITNVIISAVNGF
ncbi:MAG: aminotransferase DegT, partial [Mucilaginibacter sp.]|nr:aminotransferase DegT [Mucilaginibacter sp.]